MKILRLVGAAIALALPLLGGNAGAMPLVFTFDCTISGTGSGTNNCAEGPSVAQVRISQYDTGVLSVEARMELVGSYQLHALFLNFDGALNVDGLYEDLPLEENPPAGPQNDFNTIEFSFDESFSVVTEIEVENGGTTAPNYPGFDLMLCDNGVGQCDFDLSTTYETLGYLRSGNAFDLTPDLFDALTSDSGNVNNPDELLLATDPCMDFVPGHLRAAVHITPATSGTLSATCLSGSSYGPYYGDGEEVNVDVPEPHTFGLFLLALAGFGLRRVTSLRYCGQ